MTTFQPQEELPTRIVMRLNLDQPQDRAIAEWWARNKGRASKVGRDAIYMRVTGLDPVTGKPIAFASGANGSDLTDDNLINEAPRHAIQELEVDAERSLLLDKLGDL